MILFIMNLPVRPCSYPITPSNGRVHQISEAANGEYPPGSEALFECEDGYVVLNRSSICQHYWSLVPQLQHAKVVAMNHM